MFIVQLFGGIVLILSLSVLAAGIITAVSISRGEIRRK